MRIRSLGTALVFAVAGIVALPTGAQAHVPEGGDTRPCVTEREFWHVGGLHQTARQVRQIVDTRGVRVSNHAFDGWDADAGVAPKDEYGAPIHHRMIRRYPLCSETAQSFGYGVRFMFVEYRVRNGVTVRVEQSRVH